MKKNLFLLSILVGILQLTPGCRKNTAYNSVTSQPGDMQIAVISDLHYYDPALGDTGKCFREYLLEQGKMIDKSQAINLSLMQDLKNSPATIILVTGDMTKDGEKQNHLQIAALFAELEKAGKRVFVIPGNHDINNPYAYKYTGDTETRIDNVDGDLFDSIYGQFGYGEAIYRDQFSHSYVAVLDDNTWLLAMDGCIDQIKDSVSTGGRFLPGTLKWIKDRLTEARTKNFRVLGMIHHGLLQHFWGEQQTFPGFLLDHWQEVSAELAALGLKVVFSGHFHAQDIVRADAGGNFLFDVETGSMVNWQVAYRTMTYTKGNILKIKTQRIAIVPGTPDFQAYAKSNFEAYWKLCLTAKLTKENNPFTDSIVPVWVKGNMAYYHGDEQIDALSQARLSRLFDMGGREALIADTILNMFTDLPCPDLNVEIDLARATWTPQ